MMYYAHSPKAADEIAAQPYVDHIRAVLDGAERKASSAAGNRNFETLLLDAIRLAAEFHDMGKLDPLNQAVLSRESKSRLPLNHVDAGTAEMLRRNSKATAIAALLIYSHHRGLPDFSEVQQNHLRDNALHELFGSTKQRTDQWLDRYLQFHQSQFAPTTKQGPGEYFAPENMQVMLRMGLSCLVDADHFDTSDNYRQAYPSPLIELQPAARLKQLDRYVAGLGADNGDQRNQLRSHVYQTCRDSSVPRGLVACDSPVGSGKTTAVMAHLLAMAARHKMRRIFVVLPYTNIITQSVAAYRKCLRLAGEPSDRVVAAHHHRAEFSDLQSRHLTYLWEAPIVVTTAVQFFETIAAARTSSLRKLHQLSNSACFIDESHAALPPHLWPVAWKWLKCLSDEWNCHFVLGSGSLSQFWTLPEFSDPPIKIPGLIEAESSQASETYEARRINYCTKPVAMTLEELPDWIAQFTGPRLLIVNTVQSAAFIAKQLREFTNQSVEHLSTALTPIDREVTLQRVRERLKNSRDTDWTLVATSCVEAGVDISFRTGFRERASLNSLLQTSGRVNRSGEYNISEVWDFQLLHDLRLRKHPAFDDSVAVLGELFEQGKIAPEYCTEAMRREIRRAGMKQDAELLFDAELKKQFAEVETRFRVIDSHTETAVVDEELKRRLRNRESVTFQELQEGSVQIYANRRMDFALAPIIERVGVYEWTLGYDEFIGYMAGVVDTVEMIDSGFAFA